MGRKEIGNDGDAFVDAAPKLTSLRGSRCLDLLEPNCRVLVIGVDRFADELIAVDHPDFPDVAGVVSNDNRLADVPSESRGDISKTIENGCRRGILSAFLQQ